MLTIKAAAEQTAVPITTLRAWERRYGIASPVRTEAGYRLYDDRALEEIRAMRTLLEEGWAPRQAADEVRRRRHTATPVAAATAFDGAGLPPHEALVEAAIRLDEASLAQALDIAFSRASFEHVLEHWLTPALHLVGLAWEDGRLDVSGEHFVSAGIMRRLSSIYDASGGTGSGPRVLVGLAANCEHEIPALCFAIAARRQGLRATYLGSSLPTSAWVAATADPTVGAAALSVTATAEIADTEAVIAALRAQRPDLLVAVGGVHAEAMQGASLRFDGSITEAARQLADRVLPAGR